jgi:hypothetical protein
LGGGDRIEYRLSIGIGFVDKHHTVLKVDLVPMANLKGVAR